MPRLSSRFPWLLILAWLVLYLPRPFRLGLYLDDWWSLIEPLHATAPFSLDRLHYFVGFETNYGPRPLMGLTAFLVTSIAGPSPKAIQFISILLVLAAALSLRAWLNRLMSVFPQYRSIAADFVVVFWMAMPWMMGETAWPDVAHNLGAQILFTEIARLLLARERMTAGLAALVIGGITASGLIYEAFYFAIFPVVLLYALCGRGPAKNPRGLAALLGVCGLGQAIPIAFNRYAANIHAAVTKTFDPGWPKLVVGNILAMPNTLLNGFHEYRLLGLLLLITVVVCAVLLWNRARQSESQRLFCTYLLGLAGVAIAATLIVIVVYSAAGYGFESLGVGSRSLFAPSFWISIAVFALVCCVFLPGARSMKAALLAGSAGLVLVLALAQFHRVAEWAYVWREELRILDGAPIQEFSRLPSDAVVFYVGPSEHERIAIFSTRFDLTAAVSSRRPPSERKRPYQDLIWIYPAYRSRWAWDGTSLVEASRRGVSRFAVKTLYLWREGVPRFEPVQPGFRWPPSTAISQSPP